MNGKEGSERLRVVIVGGGTAGWMTAAALAHILPDLCTVQLIESEEIGIVGVGEATLPHLRAFNMRLGIDEADFMAKTFATYKLGIEFVDFAGIGQSYIHPFGVYGSDLEDLPFHHLWVRNRKRGGADPLDAYSLPIVASRLARFAPPDQLAAIGEVQPYDYAYQFDATRFGPYLRSRAERDGTVRTEGKVVEVEKNTANGDVVALRLESGERIAGDLFVDCSGFRSLLLGQHLGEAFEDWTPWLPCDRAVAVPCESNGPLLPFTRAIAMQAGWRWRIPLQHRTGNGYVYSSAHVSDERATECLLSSLEGPPLAEPRVLRFKAGRRERSWVGNCVAIGLASGFLEPLESTSIYLAQAAIQTLIELFPRGRVDPIERDEFNRQIDVEYDRVRDFLILHYHATTRDDSSFWTHVRTMSVPDTLHERIELFRRSGRLMRYSTGLFLEPSWIAVLIGQGIVPADYDRRADRVPNEALAPLLASVRSRLNTAATAMPDHAAFLRMSGAGAL